MIVSRHRCASIVRSRPTRPGSNPNVNQLVVHLKPANKQNSRINPLHQSQACSPSGLDLAHGHTAIAIALSSPCRQRSAPSSSRYRGLLHGWIQSKLGGSIAPTQILSTSLFSRFPPFLSPLTKLNIGQVSQNAPSQIYLWLRPCPTTDVLTNQNQTVDAFIEEARA
jgi:hypothetical protein